MMKYWLGLAALLTGCSTATMPPSGPPASSQAVAAAARTGSAPAIWFHPLPAANSWPGRTAAGGSVDFLELFDMKDSWPEVSAKTSVFGVYAPWPATISAPVLKKFAGFLQAHHMSVEVEAPALEATKSCGANVEGFAPDGTLDGFTRTYLSRMKKAGIDLAYIKVDEPYYYGSVSTETNACRWPVARVVRGVAQFVRLVHEYYPRAKVGDVEPVIPQQYPGDVVAAIVQWHAAYKVASGHAFPFFFADMFYGDPQWEPLALRMERAIHGSGMPFGIIYTGDTDLPGKPVTNDLQWADNAIARFKAFEIAGGARPDYVLFQSWEPHPRHTLPESDRATFTGIINVYLAAKAGQ